MRTGNYNYSQSVHLHAVRKTWFIVFKLTCFYNLNRANSYYLKSDWRTKIMWLGTECLHVYNSVRAKQHNYVIEEEENKQN